jgi:hypothetical protein
MATGVLLVIVGLGILIMRWRYLRKVRAGERPRQPKWTWLGASEEHVDKMNEWMWVFGPIFVIMGFALIVTA